MIYAVITAVTILSNLGFLLNSIDTSMTVRLTQWLTNWLSAVHGTNISMVYRYLLVWYRLFRVWECMHVKFMFVNYPRHRRIHSVRHLFLKKKKNDCICVRILKTTNILLNIIGLNRLRIIIHFQIHKILYL